MKLRDALSPEAREEFEAKGYRLPTYDREALKQRTYEAPAWVHFGAGNIFRAFQATLLDRVLEAGEYDRGVIVAEGYDFDLIDRTYRPFDNLALAVVLHSDGSIEKNVIGSITESLKADPAFPEDTERLKEIFRNPSLAMVTFSITEKGYLYSEEDLARGLDARLMMGKLTGYLYERSLAGGYPLTLQSTDNCSHNGDQVKKAIYAYAKSWADAGIVPNWKYFYNGYKRSINSGQLD